MADNLLLASLPRQERERLDSFLDPVNLRVSDVLIEPDKPIDYIYFPIDCVTSTVQELSDGSTVEAGLMGVEGFIGVQFWLHSRTTPSRTLIQVDGKAIRMRSQIFLKEVMEKQSPLNDLLARYTHSFLVMVSQTAACNRLHNVDERLCRWLKMIHSRVRRDVFSMRQEFMAQMLGVHRPSVSVAANILQSAGLIRYNRGEMEILDAKGLEEGACECYELVEKEVSRVFGKSWRELAARGDRED